MTQNALIHQNLPHPDRLTPRLETVVQFYQPINKLLPAAALSVVQTRETRILLNTSFKVLHIHLLIFVNQAESFISSTDAKLIPGSDQMCFCRFQEYNILAVM